MNRAVEYMDVHSSTPPRRVCSPDEPATLVDVFTGIARNHKRADTLNYKSDGRWVSVSSDELLARARRIAAGLHAIGLHRGDRIALLSESRVEWTLTDAGCIFGGIIDVPIYPTLAPPQVCYILNDSGASVLFIEGRAKFDELKRILAECPQVKQIVYFDNDGLTAAEGLSISPLAALEDAGRQFQEKEPGCIDELAHQITPDDLATIIYTSGTTGEPKGVMLTHSNIVTNLIDSSDHLDFGEADAALSVLPLSHVYERQAMYMYLNQGIAVYFAESLQ